MKRNLDITYLDIGHNPRHKVTAYALAKGGMHYADLKDPGLDGHASEDLFPDEIFDTIIVQGRINHTTEEISISSMSATDRQVEYVKKELRRKYRNYTFILFEPFKKGVILEERFKTDWMESGVVTQNVFIKKYWYNIKTGEVFTLLEDKFHHSMALLMYPEKFGIDSKKAKDILNRENRGVLSIYWNQEALELAFRNNWVRVLATGPENTLTVQHPKITTKQLQKLVKFFEKELRIVQGLLFSRHNTKADIALTSEKEVSHFIKTGKFMTSMQSLRESLTKHKDQYQIYTDIAHKNDVTHIELWYMDGANVAYVKPENYRQTHYSLGLLDDLDPNNVWGRIDHKERKISMTFDWKKERKAIIAAKTLKKRFRDYELILFKQGDVSGVYMYEENLQEKVVSGHKVDKYLVNPSVFELQNFFSRNSTAIRLIIDPADNKLYVWKAHSFVMHQEFFRHELVYTPGEVGQLYAHAKNHSNTGHIDLDTQRDRYHTFYVGENILKHHKKVIDGLREYIKEQYEFNSIEVMSQARAKYYEFEPTVLTKENVNEVYKDSGLGKWFHDQSATKEPGWDRYDTSGKRAGKCGDAEEGDAYAACLSKQKADKLGKKGIANFVKRKRKAQKNAGRDEKGDGGKGQKPVNVDTGTSKKKTIKEENTPNNPKLWSKAISKAKAKFDVYPCVPLDSRAITRNGPAYYDEIDIGDEILTYNIDKDELEWQPVEHKHYYENADIMEIGKRTGFSIRCTPNHKWVVWRTDRSKKELVKAKDLNTHMKIIMCSSLQNESSLLLNEWSKKDNWVEKILSMDYTQREIYLASSIVYDGWDYGVSKKISKRHTFGFKQKEYDHLWSSALAAYLNGYYVNINEKTISSASYIRNKFDHNTQNLYKKNIDEKEDVWCPTTKNNTWVMIQNGLITITGNSAYANAWASKWYKEQGGTWSKKTKKESTNLSFGGLRSKLEEKVNKDNMPCNKPSRDSGGNKKFKVKACKDGKEKIVRFGDPNMEIKRDDPERRKSFRARHNCADKKDKFKAGYWSCRQWRAGAKVEEGVSEPLSEADIKAGGLTVDFKNGKNITLPSSKKAVKNRIYAAKQNPGTTANIQVLYNGAGYQGKLSFDGKKWSLQGVKLPKQDQSKPMKINLKDIRYLQVPVR